MKLLLYFSQMDKDKAIVLLSGGIDSATTLAIARKEGLDITCLSFDYSQRHKYELNAATRIAKALQVSEHIIIEIDLRKFGGSALTSSIDVPKGRTDREIGKGIPITYVPARNTIFLSYALALAEVRGAKKIFIGANAVDFSGYPDCRPEYIRAFQKLANVATKSGVEGRGVTILAPLIDFTKSEIIQQGMKLKLDYSLTFSCYDPVADGIACGECDSCIIRKKGFAEAGMPDPTKYTSKVIV